MKKISACPGWLNLSPDRRSFMFAPEKAAIVRKIFELSIGGVGSYSIANYLNRQNITPFGPSPTWDHTTIDAMLRNRAMVGEYQPKSYAGGSKKGVPVGLPVSDYYPAVVDEQTFQAAQVARRRNLVGGRGRKGNFFANIFDNLTTCLYCNNPVKFHRNGESQSLICEKVSSNEGCIRAAWSYKNFENSALYFLVHPALIERFTDDRRDLLTQLAARAQSSSGLQTYEMRLEIALLLRRIISELKIASGGLEPDPTLADARVRRDNPKRCFQVRLWDGPTYIGAPVF